MKVKTSITLSDDLLQAVDESARGSSRSAFIEAVLRDYFRERVRADLDARDLERLNASADALNAEAETVLEIQDWPDP